MSISPFPITICSMSASARMIRSTNALNGFTTYTNYFDGSGQLVKVTTNADAGTRIETYAKDGSLLTVSGTAAFPAFYEYGVDSDGVFTTQVKSNTITGSTNEWTKTSTDLVGRTYKTVFPSASGNHSAISFYNNKGQLQKQVDPDGITMLYTYNGLGQLDLTAIDMDQDGTINTNAAGVDRITERISDVIFDSAVSANVNRTRNYVWTEASSTPLLVSTSELSTDGLKTWNTVVSGTATVTNRSITIYASGGFRYLTNIAPNGSYTVTTYSNGQVISMVLNDANNAQVSSASYGYDTHGRQNTIVDARTGTTTVYHNNADQVSGALTPPPATGQSGQVTSNYFDLMGRITTNTLADSTTVISEYYATGLPKRKYGSHTYAAGYGYDDQGRMIAMTNWSFFSPTSPSGARVTTWSYNTYTGRLDSKTYAGGVAGPGYSHTPAGRLLTRSWARGTNTTYGYNNAGDIASVSYNDGGVTPNMTNGYDRRGRLTAVTNGPSICSLVYNDVNQSLSESYSGGPLNGISVTNGYDSLLRRTNVLSLTASSVLTSNSYAYDAASRMNSVSDGTNSATYSYLANSALVDHITFQQSGTARMTTSNSYDKLNRLTLISTANGSSAVLDSHTYVYNTANQRTSVTNSDGTYWIYLYDSLGQVADGKKFWADGTPVAGQQFGYGADDIGNRTVGATGGDQWGDGSNLRESFYTANNLNQYTSRTVPATLDIIGSATNTAIVTVNNQSTYRKGNYYRVQLSLNNSSGAVWQPVTNLAVLNEGTTDVRTNAQIGNVFLPQTPENFSYDADGNLTNDGRWSYVWDGENRLINMTSQSSAPTGSKLKLDFLYDYMGRRIQKLVSTNSGSGYVAEYTNRFAYDGWNLLATLNPAPTLVESFMWGLDLSGSIQGAGGVGGLLKSTYHGSSATNCFPTFDGNGNVTMLANATDGTLAAQYEYGPFGEVIRASGPMAKVNPFTFQTEFYDWETDKIYWKNRYYDSSPGRWLSRDPVNEPGFNLLANANSGKFQQNFDEEEAVDSGNFGDSDDGATVDTTTEQANDLLYVFVQNNPLNLIDELGLTVYLQAHGVALGFNHSKVTMVVGCGSTWLGKPPFVNPMPNQPGYFYATIGAGPIHHMLVSGLNRSRDIQLQRNKFSTVIPDPAGMSDDDFIGKLIAANAAYPNDLPYALFPTKKGKRYNSNGYASGILLYVTGSMPPRPPHTPGFNKPVPASKF